MRFEADLFTLGDLKFIEDAIIFGEVAEVGKVKGDEGG